MIRGQVLPGRHHVAAFLFLLHGELVKGPDLISAPGCLELEVEAPLLQHGEHQVTLLTDLFEYLSKAKADDVFGHGFHFIGAHELYLVDPSPPGATGDKGVVEVCDGGASRGNALFPAHFFQGLGDPACLNVVGAASTAGVAGDTLPDQGVFKGGFSVACNDHADEAIRCKSDLFTHGAPGGAAPALIASKNILVGTFHHLNSKAFCIDRVVGPDVHERLLDGRAVVV